MGHVIPPDIRQLMEKSWLTGSERIPNINISIKSGWIPDTFANNQPDRPDTKNLLSGTNWIRPDAKFHFFPIHNLNCKVSFIQCNFLLN